ncbi:MAG TPA: hypothetical protein DEH25_18145 [Chloroflexi bacterium]|nr:hypothetical protein [Chloroflexota bacterium]HBY07785.1 hypothetical protein [Chloroflexota bacterium]
MLILAALLVSLLIPLAILGLSFTRLRPGWLWLAAVIGSLAVWLLVILTRNQIPSEITLFHWRPEFWLGTSPTLLVDEISWLFAVAVTTLPIVVLLTDVAHLAESDPQNWASILALSGVGLFAVVAENPITLLLAWGVIDIFESLVFLQRVQSSQERERVVIAFSVRVGGVFLLMVAMLQALANGNILTFHLIPPEVSGTLLLATGARLGVIPPHQPYLREPSLRRGLGTITRLVPVAASLVLVVRVADIGVSNLWLSAFMLLSSISVIFGALALLRAEDELQGRPYWILGLSAFALVSAAQGLVVASAAWGLALLFSGALLFLFSFRDRKLLIFPLLGATGFVALPFTPAWEGAAIFGVVSWGYRLIFSLALALLLIGYLQHALRSKIEEERFERWMWLIYPLGFAILFLTQFGMVYFQWAQSGRMISFQTPGWWFGLLSLGLAAIFMVLNHRGSLSTPAFLGRLNKIFNLNWLYHIFWWIYRQIGRLLNLFSLLLEGEGGVLWALLILILLVVSLSVFSTGGRQL